MGLISIPCCSHESMVSLANFCIPYSAVGVIFMVSYKKCHVTSCYDSNNDHIRVVTYQSRFSIEGFGIVS